MQGAGGIGWSRPLPILGALGRRGFDARRRVVRAAPFREQGAPREKSRSTPSRAAARFGRSLFLAAMLALGPFGCRSHAARSRLRGAGHSGDTIAVLVGRLVPPSPAWAVEGARVEVIDTARGAITAMRASPTGTFRYVTPLPGGRLVRARTTGLTSPVYRVELMRGRQDTLTLRLQVEPRLHSDCFTDACARERGP